MVPRTPRINFSIELISTLYDNYFSKPQHNDYIKRKPITQCQLSLNLIANTNYEIQIQIIKACCKLYIHEIKQHKILKAQKIKDLKMLKPSPKKN